MSGPIIVRPYVRLPWWLNLLLGKQPRLRRPPLSSFYTWRWPAKRRRF